MNVRRTVAARLLLLAVLLFFLLFVLQAAVTTVTQLTVFRLLSFSLKNENYRVTANFGLADNKFWESWTQLLQLASASGDCGASLDVIADRLCGNLNSSDVTECLEKAKIALVHLAGPCVGALSTAGFENPFQFYASNIMGKKAFIGNKYHVTDDDDHQNNRERPLFVMFGLYDHPLKDYILSEMYTLRRLLTETYGWTSVTWTTKVSDNITWTDFRTMLLSRLGRLPDAILMMEEYYFVGHLERTSKPAKQLFLQPHQTDNCERDLIDLIAWTNDLHWFTEESKQDRIAVYNSASLLVGAYEPVFERVVGLPRSSVDFKHLPHSAGPDFELPIHPDPTPKVLLTGSTDLPWYPYRNMVLLGL